MLPSVFTVAFPLPVGILSCLLLDTLFSSPDSTEARDERGSHPAALRFPSLFLITEFMLLLRTIAFAEFGTL